MMQDGSPVRRAVAMDTLLAFLYNLLVMLLLLVIIFRCFMYGTVCGGCLSEVGFTYLRISGLVRIVSPKGQGSIHSCLLVY